jgi:hypothetical protein
LIRTFFVGSRSGLLGSDPDPGLNKLLYINFFVCVKAINTLGISVVELYGSWIYFLEHISSKKISGLDPDPPHYVFL